MLAPKNQLSNWMLETPAGARLLFTAYPAFADPAQLLHALGQGRISGNVAEDGEDGEQTRFGAQIGTYPRCRPRQFANLRHSPTQPSAAAAVK